MHVAAALIVLYWNGTLPVKPHAAATKARHYHDSVPLPSKTCMLMLFFPPAACKPCSTVALPFPVGMPCQAVRVTFLFSALFRVRLHKFQHKQFALCLSHLCFLCCCFLLLSFRAPRKMPCRALQVLSHTRNMFPYDFFLLSVCILRMLRCILKLNGIVP